MDEWWPKIEQAFLERGWSRLEQYAQKAAKKRVISPALESLLRAEAAYQSLAWNDPLVIPHLNEAQLSEAFHWLDLVQADHDVQEWARLLRFKLLAASQQWLKLESREFSLELNSAVELVLTIQAIYAQAMAAEHVLGQAQAIQGYGMIVAYYRRHLIANDGDLKIILSPALTPFIQGALLSYARLNVRCKGIGSLAEQRQRWFDAAMSLRLLLTMEAGEEALSLYLQCLEARFPQAAEYRSSFEIIPTTAPTVSLPFNLSLNQSTQSLRFQAPSSVTSFGGEEGGVFVPNGPEEDVLLRSALLDSLISVPLIASDRQAVHSNPMPHLKQWIKRLAVLPGNLVTRLVLSLPERGAVACHTMGMVILALDAEDTPMLFPWIVSLAQDYAAMGGVESEVWLAWARALAQLKDPAGMQVFLRYEVDPSRYWSRAMVLHAAEQRDEAVSLLNEVLKVDPDHVSACWLRGQCLLELGRLAEAEDDLQHCLLVDGGEYGAAWLSMIQLRAIGGRWSDWRDALEIAEGEAGREELWPLRLSLLKKLGMRSEALALCRAALRLAYGITDDEAEAEEQVLSVDQLTASETTGTAAHPDFVNRFLGPFLVAPEPFAIRSIPGFPLALNHPKAMELAARRDLGARTATWWIEAASLLLSLDRAADAHRCLKQATLLYPQSPLIPAVKAKLAARKGNLTEAMDLTRESGDQLLLIERLMGEGEWLEAEVRAREACQVTHPHDPTAWHLLGRLLMERGQWQEARDTLQRAMELEQTSPILPAF